MKKLIVNILATLGIFTAIFASTSNIFLTDYVSYAADDDAEEDQDPNFEPTTIPRPDYLPGPDETENRGNKQAFGDKILPRAALMFISFSGAAALIFVIIGGVRYVLSFGNEEAIGNAKKQVIYALVGFVIALLAYTIVTIVTNVELVDDTTERATTQPVDE